MTDQIEFAVTPFRLGEMYVNTVTNLADMLLAESYDLAAQGRDVPGKILAPLPNLGAADLLAFIAGAAQRADFVLDSLTPEPKDKDQGTNRPSDVACPGVSDPVLALRSRLDQALQLVSHSETRDEGFSELGLCDFDLQALRARAHGKSEDYQLLAAVQQAIDAAIGDADTRALTMFINGQRHAHLFSASGIY